MTSYLFGALLAIITLAALSACAQATPTPAATFALPTATSTASAPTPTAAPPLPNISRLDQGPSRLLEVMEKLPASFKEQGMWFSDYNRALELAGAPRPRSFEEYMALSGDAHRAWVAARHGIVNMADLMDKTRVRGRQWEKAFGFGMFDMDLLVSIGTYSALPLQLAYVEGDFREEGIRERLLDLGYQERFAGGSVYYAIEGDFKASFRDPVGRLAVSSMNRVFVEDGALVASPETERMVAVMEHSAGGHSALANDVMFSSLAASLGDPLSAALLTRSAAVKLKGGTRQMYLLGATRTIFETPEAWGALHRWEAVGAGYVIADNSTWWGVSLFYSDPGSAEADAEELILRMASHKTAVLFQPQQPFEEYCSSLSSSIHGDENGSTLTGWCKVGDNPSANEWWSHFLGMQDLGFLLP